MQGKMNARQTPDAGRSPLGRSLFRSRQATTAALLLALVIPRVGGQEPEGEPAGFQAGFAERDISPDIGMEQPGGYGKSYHRSFHDACKVRVAVFDDGREAAALVGIDALFIHGDTVRRVRQRIAEQTDLQPTSILFGASHSHSSGPMAGVMPGEYDEAPEWIQQLAYEHSTCADPEYLAMVEAALVEAVVEAYAGRTPVRAGIGRGAESRVAFNRRFRMRTGFTVTHPRQGNPDILEAAGPVDPEVGVIGVWSEEGRLEGCVVNFACHATTSPGGISANYIYYLERAIRGFFGEHVVVVFLNGASGDVTQVDNLSPYELRRGEASARFVGGRVGAEAVKVLLDMQPGDLGPVRSDVAVLEIPRRRPSAERVARCREVAQRDPTTVDRTEWTFAKEIVLLDWKLKTAPSAEVEVQAIQVGPAVFLTDPAEFFCDFGLRLKDESTFPYTFPVSLANGCVGYVPTTEAFGERGGGYETRLTSYSNLVIDAGDRMVDAALELTRSWQPGEVPEPPPAPAFRGGPWSYGNVRPEID